MRKQQLHHVYALLKKIRTQGSTTHRLLVYAGAGVANRDILDDLEDLGFIYHIQENRSKIWRTAPAGLDLLKDIEQVYHALEMIE